MSPGTAKRVFLGGTVSSAILFLVLTADTHRQVRALTRAQHLSPQVVAGKKVWHRYNCNDCHTILGFGGYYAPDMTRAYWRLGGEGIKAWVRNPAAFTSWRKMPRLNLSEQELNNLGAFLEWTSGISNNNWPPQDEKFRPATIVPPSEAKPKPAAAAPAAIARPKAPSVPAEIEALLKRGGCYGCHRIGKAGGTLGPGLDGVGKRLKRETIRKILTDPRSVNAAARMPVPSLSEKDRERLADYLSGLK